MRGIAGDWEAIPAVQNNYMCMWVINLFKAAYFDSILLKEVWHECCKLLVWIVFFPKIKLLNLCIENVRLRLHVYSLKKYTNVWSKSYCLEVCLYIWNIYPFNVLNDFLFSNGAVFYLHFNVCRTLIDNYINTTLVECRGCCRKKNLMTIIT